MKIEIDFKKAIMKSNEEYLTIEANTSDMLKSEDQLIHLIDVLHEAAIDDEKLMFVLRRYLDKKFFDIGE